jgi:hypothetical protein
MEGEGNGGAGGPAPLAQRKVYRGRRTTEMNQIDESMLILPREEGISNPSHLVASFSSV